MTKRPRSAAQLANDERLRNRKATVATPADEPVVAQPEAIAEEQIAPEQSESDLQRQLNEMKAYLFELTKNQPAPGVQQNNQGGIVGTFEKFTVDPANYPDPSDRLSKEPRLVPFAFGHNFELDYQVHVSQYDTKDGRNVKEPRFMIELRRVVLDDDGTRTNERYIVRKLTFHEDPQAAIQVARENGVNVDDFNEKDFLNEMRYYRVRDWLLDIFYPPKAQKSQAKREVVIDNQVVEMITVNSEDSASIPFDQLKTKLR